MIKFCSLFFSGVPQSVTRFWGASELRLKIENDDYHVYMAPNVTAVKQLHDDHQVCLHLKMFARAFLDFHNK